MGSPAITVESLLNRPKLPDKMWIKIQQMQQYEDIYSLQN